MRNRVYFGSYSLEHWMKLLRNGDIILPKYQRHFVWEKERVVAQLAARVRPCGKIGRYLYEELEAYNLNSLEPPELRKGENWCLGDSPVVGALLGCGWRGNFHTETAPLIADDLRYLPNPGGKEIRVYDYVDVRMILEDMYAKLKLVGT